MGEQTTPTGAAVLTTLADGFGPMPAMTLDAVGVGAGTRDGQTRPNVLRVFIGQALAGGEQDQVVVVETNIDDQDAKTIGYLFDRLLELGALDVYATPIVMKKNRPGVKVSVLVEPGKLGVVEEAIFSETATFGLRRWTCERTKLQRTHQTVQTPYGPVRIKLGYRGGAMVTATPEYEDCRRTALDTGIPLRRVIEAANDAWRQERRGPG